MGSDLSTIAKALSIPFQSAVHDCAQMSSESDCSIGCCACHTKTIAADLDDTEPDDAEIDIETKEKG